MFAFLNFAGSKAFAQRDTVIYELTINQKEVNIAGKKTMGMTINGDIPGPTLHFTEGDYAVMYVKNEMDVETSVHWHGLLVPNFFDGVPYLTTPPIKPGKTQKYEFPLKQAGTYWYHSHTGLQEQSGVYGSIQIEPKEKTLAYDADLVIVLSDWTYEKPKNVLRTLKRGLEWYDIKKGTATPLNRVIARGALGAQFNFWRQRMDGADIADIYYPAFLTNGQPTREYPEFEPGQKVRLRFINAAASSQFWLTFGGEDPLLVAADGLDVVPVRRNKTFIAVAETYDFIVTVPQSGKMEVRASVQDGSGQTSAFLGKGQVVSAPDVPRPDKIAMMQQMAAMDMKMGAPAIKFRPSKDEAHEMMQEYGMQMDDMQGMDEIDQKGTNEMDHSQHEGMKQMGPETGGEKKDTASMQQMEHMNHQKMGEMQPDTTASHKMDHTRMNHTMGEMKKDTAGSGKMNHAQMHQQGMEKTKPDTHKMGEMKKDTAARQMDHSNMHPPMGEMKKAMSATKQDTTKHNPANMHHEGMQEAKKDTAAAGKKMQGHMQHDMGKAEPGMPAMDMQQEKGKSMAGMQGHGDMKGMDMFAEYNYDYLRSPEKTDFKDDRPTKEILLNLTGNMVRYIWSMNGVPLKEDDKIKINKGEVTRVTLNNLTMMHHPMHLHGHFFRVINENGEYSPLKHTVNVAPMQKVVIEFDANEYGDWFFHCHILYHMDAGMARIFSYDTPRDERMKGYPVSILTNESNHYFTWGIADVASHMTELNLVTSNLRNQFNLSAEYGWNKNLEAEFTYERYLYDYLRVFGGVNAENETEDSMDDIEVTAVAGIRYLTPYLFNLDVRIDNLLRPQISFSREVMIFPRTALFGTYEYQADFGWRNELPRNESGIEDNFKKEVTWNLGLEYFLSKNFSLTGSYDNRFGAGGGLSARF
ncbi:multicopper oxidase domain-containing protein [Pontibacter sp. E15-1]|nr:multicopper oxidase domain-containing protein [Pontibacter sp. E15-1]MCJ8163376.1 multicopper oxidase domain-containing protein [Pontibacter sp. E15-1]